MEFRTLQVPEGRFVCSKEMSPPRYPRAAELRHVIPVRGLKPNTICRYAKFPNLTFWAGFFKFGIA